MHLTAPPRSGARELLDEPEIWLQHLSPNLRDIRILNRWFGGTSLALGCLRRFTPGGTTATLLDVATGSADIPLAALRDARGRGAVLEITVVDVSADVLAHARSLVSGESIRLVQADARSLPFEDSEFDIVTCCLALHHFDPQDAVRVLREMRRVARRVVIVTDLHRSYLGYAGVWLATRTIARNRLTRHDGPLSVLRAYRAPELRALASAAGLNGACLRRHIFFRQTLIAPGARDDA